MQVWQTPALQEGLLFGGLTLLVDGIEDVSDPIVDQHEAVKHVHSDRAPQLAVQRTH